jgi:transposase-like protein
MNQTPVKVRRKFDETFKRETLNDWLASGKSAEVIAQELGINSKRLYSWKQRFCPCRRWGEGGGRTPAGSVAGLQTQLAASQRENRLLR